MKPKKRELVAGDPKKLPTPEELAVLRDHFRRKAAETAPRVKVNAATISPDHPNEAIGSILLAEALGTTDHDFLAGLLQQLASANLQGGKVDERALNFRLSVVKGIKPKDQVEAMLAAQMAAVHEAMMRFTERLAQANTLAEQDSAERTVNKLARTYVTQMEALKRYRTGGEQNVTVQHVSVSEGGQAIVGNVTQAAARETALEKAANSPPALSNAQERPMAIIGEAERAPVASRRRKDDGRSPA
jgi:hypothetical protein